MNGVACCELKNHASMLNAIVFRPMSFSAIIAHSARPAADQIDASLHLTNRRNKIQRPARFSRIRIEHRQHCCVCQLRHRRKPGNACRRPSQSTDISLAVRTASCYNSFTKSNKT
jgi:hypothetical protein